MQEYYFISSEGQQVGPVPGEQLLSYGIAPKTLVWGRNMSGWTTADSVPEIVALFASQQQGGQSVQQDASASQQSDPEMVVTPAIAEETIAEYPAVEDTVAPEKKSNKRLTVWLWIVIAILAIGAGVLAFLYIDTNSKYNRASARNASLQNVVSNMEDMVNDYDNLVNSISTTYPIIITDIELANVYKNGEIETDYGSTIYDYCTMYLQPRITYTGLVTGEKEFKIKWYMPNGDLRTGNNSPSGFSFSDTVNINTGENNTYVFSGWGNETMGNWSSGRYRLEIWYEDVCLKAKTFRVY